MEKKPFSIVAGIHHIATILVRYKQQQFEFEFIRRLARIPELFLHNAFVLNYFHFCIQEAHWPSHMSTCAQSQTGQDEDGSSSSRNPNAAAAAAHAAAEVAAAAAAASHGVDPTAAGNGAAGGHFLNAQVSAAAAVARNPLSNGPQRGMPVSVI